MSIIDQKFHHKHPGSLELARRAREVFPDGVTHDARWINPFPLYMTHAEGSRKWDVDGNEYVDYVIGHGALILGHGHPKVVEAVTRQMRGGSHLGGSTRLEIEWSEVIKRLVPCAEKVRFVASGTEASLMAVRLARAFTGRDKLLKFEHHFHGWNDYVIPGEADSLGGVPAPTLATVVVVKPDIRAVEAALAKDRDIAAVILEPTGAHGGLLPLTEAFVRELREVTERHGAILIFDEVVTGFRTSKGGAQLRFGVTPDLSIHAKILAGGLPGGAVVGRADLLDMIQHRQDRHWETQRRVAHPGTFNANPLSAVAGTTALEIIETEPINAHAEAMAGRLRDGINRVFTRNGLRGTAYGFASIVFVAFGVQGELDDDGLPDLSHDELKRGAAPNVIAAFRKAVLNEGIDTQGGGIWRVAAAHSEADIDFTIEGVERAVMGLRADGVI